jgi:hypothetical protein
VGTGNPEITKHLSHTEHAENSKELFFDLAGGTAKSKRLSLFEANRYLPTMENDKLYSVTSKSSVRSTDK